MKPTTRYCSCGLKFTVNPGPGAQAALARIRESHEKLGHFVTERPARTREVGEPRWWVA